MNKTHIKGLRLCVITSAHGGVDNNLYLCLVGVKRLSEERWWVSVFWFYRKRRKYFLQTVLEQPIILLLHKS